MSQELTRLILDVVLGLQVISILLALYYWKRISEPFKFVTYLMILSMLTEFMASEILKYRDSNLPLLHVYTLFEFVVSALIFQKAGLFNRYSNKQFWMLIGGVSCLIILNSLFIQKPTTYNSISRSFVQVLLVSFSVGYIFQLKKHTPESGALNVMNAALLLVNAGSLFIFMFGNVLLDNRYSNMFWQTNLILNLIFQVLIITSIWMASRTRKLQF